MSFVSGWRGKSGAKATALQTLRDCWAGNAMFGYRREVMPQSARCAGKQCRSATLSTLGDAQPVPRGWQWKSGIPRVLCLAKPGAHGVTRPTFAKVGRNCSISNFDLADDAKYCPLGDGRFVGRGLAGKSGAEADRTPDASRLPGGWRDIRVSKGGHASKCPLRW